MPVHAKTHLPEGTEVQVVVMVKIHPAGMRILRRCPIALVPDEILLLFIQHRGSCKRNASTQPESLPKWMLALLEGMPKTNFVGELLARRFRGIAPGYARCHR